jgi:hypothetical protein
MVKKANNTEINLIRYKIGKNQVIDNSFLKIRVWFLFFQ